jgi:cell division transport system permease protein
MARDYIPGRRGPDTPSNTVAYFFREALRRILVSKRTSFVAIAMIAIALFILGAFLLLAENLGRAVERWQGNSRVNVYLENDATPEQIRTVQSFLASRPELRRNRFVTPDEALATFKKDFANLAEVVDQLGTNPFPPSFRIEVSPETIRSAAFRNDVANLQRLGGIEEVQFDWEWLARIRRLIGIVNLAGLVAGGILAVAAAFTIANVIRLTMLLYREEIEIMRLVGATERIIRGPFLIEGLLQGTFGAIVAVALLYGAFAFARHNLGVQRSLIAGFLFSVFLPWQKIAALFAGGMIAGWLGSWMSVRERGTEEA